MGLGGVIGSVVGGFAQGSAAKDAAKAQEAAAAKDIAFQTETRDLIRNDLSPYRDGGQDAFNAYRYEMGLMGEAPIMGGSMPQIEEIPAGGPQRYPAGNSTGRLADINSRMTGSMPAAMYDRLPGRPGATFGSGAGGGGRFRVNGREFATREEAEAYARANMTGGTRYGGFQKSQDYLFGLNEGTSAIEASAAARGGLFSGATMRDLNQFGQDYGSQRRGEYLNRLAGVADTGMNAASMSGNASMAAAGNVSNALAAQGNAAAAGAIGVGNAINSGIGNALGAWNYQQQINRGQQVYGGGR